MMIMMMMREKVKKVCLMAVIRIMRWLMMIMIMREKVKKKMCLMAVIRIMRWLMLIMIIREKVKTVFNGSDQDNEVVDDDNDYEGES